MVSFDDLLRNITDGTVLPAPFCLPDGIPAHECQMFLFPSGPEQFSLLKFIRFKNRTNRHRIATRFSGTAMYLDQQKLPSPRITPMVLQHMLTNLGGQCLVNRELAVAERD
eukprot:5734291-Amphidinium_carterae.1